MAFPRLRRGQAFRSAWHLLQSLTLYSLKLHVQSLKELSFLNF